MMEIGRSAENTELPEKPGKMVIITMEIITMVKCKAMES